MSELSVAGKDTLRIRAMTIDDFAEVFHIGEEVFLHGRGASIACHSMDSEHDISHPVGAVL